MWVRVTCPLPDDRLIAGLCAHVRLRSRIRVRSVEKTGSRAGGPSVDHALWFHKPIRADDWVLIDLSPTKARGIRGLYSGILSDRHGTLGAFLQQELLLRWGPTS